MREGEGQGGRSERERDEWKVREEVKMEEGGRG